MPPYQQTVITNPVPGRSKQKKLIIVIIALAALTALLFIISALFSGHKSTSDQQINQLYTQQKQMLEILDKEGRNATSSDAKNLIARSNALLKSDLLALKDQGIKSSKDANANLNTDAITKTLADAKQGNRFDEAITDFIKQEASDFKAKAQSAINQTGNSELKSMLNQMITNYDSLL